MIGDGENDIGAMREADISIAVVDNWENYNNDVAAVANFIIHKDDMVKLPEILKVMLEADERCISLTKFSVFYHGVLMLGTNLSQIIFGVPVSSALTCFLSSFYCLSASVFASNSAFFISTEDDEVCY